MGVAPQQVPHLPHKNSAPLRGPSHPPKQNQNREKATKYTFICPSLAPL